MTRYIVDFTNVAPDRRLDALKSVLGRFVDNPVSVPSGPYRVNLGVHRVDPLALKEVAPPIGVSLSTRPHPHMEMDPTTVVRDAVNEITRRVERALNHLSGHVEVRLSVVAT